MQLTAWQKWYSQKVPAAPPAKRPEDQGLDKWSYEELLTFLNTSAGLNGDPQRGRQTYVAAQCAACHRKGNHGESIGPDLTTVAQRFQRKEILEAIVFPNHEIPERYSSRTLTVNGRTHTGFVASRGPKGVTVLLPSGKKLSFSHGEVDDIQPSSVSAMPGGLLNPLSLDEVADLFAYLNSSSTPSTAGRPTAAKR